jgi:hypothetical protein
MPETSTVPACRAAHVCALLEETAVFQEIVASCAQEGFSEGKQVLVVAGSGSLGCVRGMLDGADEREASGELRLVTWTRMYSHARVGFDACAALESLQAFAAEACGHRHCRGLRVISHMEWVVSAAGGNPRSIGSYERGIDRMVSDGADLISMCMYPVRGLSGELLMELLSVHPKTLVRGKLVESPFFASEPNA